jgi:molecular chaperone DnaJ
VPGGDIQRAVHLNLLDSLHGKEIELEVERQRLCEECQGSGDAPGSQPVQCSTCGGHGMVQQVRDTLLGRIATTTTCPACRGEGYKASESCRACHGRGTQPRHEKVKVHVPPGIDDGNVLRVNGGGHKGRGGAPDGDLLVGISMEPDKRFQREGAELLTELPVSFADLALGATVEVPGLEGPLELRIPAGTQSHEMFTLRGHGLPRLRGSGRGNLHTRVKVDVPRKPTREQRELLEQLRELDGHKGAGKAEGGLKGLFGGKRRSPKSGK